MHRDLKPENILNMYQTSTVTGGLTAKTLHLKLADFGLARFNENTNSFGGQVLASTFSCTPVDLPFLCLHFQSNLPGLARATTRAGVHAAVDFRADRHDSIHRSRSYGR
jgi:serine/threonine protein kinase